MCRRRHPRRRFRCARQPQSVPQLRQHRRVSDGIACYLDVAYLQRLRIDAQWTLRHSLRYSAPCFLRFHSPSPMNLMPVLSTSSCSADLVRWWRSSTCKVFWHRQTVLKSGTGQYSLANCSSPCTMLSACCKGWPNRHLMLRQNWMAASGLAARRAKPSHPRVQPHRQRTVASKYAPKQNLPSWRESEVALFCSTLPATEQRASSLQLE